jgi:hypothetical protein
MTTVGDGLYQYGGMPVGADLMGVGNVYYVCQTANTTVHADMVQRFGGKKYKNDHSNVLHSTIATALTAMVAYRNDYVIVSPDSSDYDNAATITLAAGAGHLICPAGLGPERGCIRAATIDASSAAHGITITGRGAEVAGFWIRGYTEKGCITSTGLGAFIHHNDCAVTCTTSAAFGITIGAAGMQSIVSRNFIFSNAGGGTWLHGIDVNPSATRTKVTNNEIHVGNSSTLTVGIDTTVLGTNTGASMMTVADNIILENATATLSAGIRTGPWVLAVRNLVGMTTTANAFIGGTAGESLVDNRISTDGGKAGT